MPRLRVQLPEGVRCAIALSYDLEMCAGYEPDRINHGRILPEVQRYTLDLCSVAEEFGIKLHFFYVANGFDQTYDCLREILDRGHYLDSHTYTHLPLITGDLPRLDEELALTNDLFERRLGWTSTILRGPGGYQDGLDGKPENQRIVLAHGFKWVSCRFDRANVTDDRAFVLGSPERDRPYIYPTGLVELPIQGYTDRSFFETVTNVAPQEYEAWRTQRGGRAVPDGWRAPWTAPGALDDWLEYQRQGIDYAYERRLLWLPGWHPATHYLHDRQNVVLRRVLEHCRAKPEPILVCTLRDVPAMLREDAG